MTTEVKTNTEVTQRAVLETQSPAKTPAELLRQNLVTETRKKLDEGNEKGALEAWRLQHEPDEKYTGNVDGVTSAQKTDRDGNKKREGDELTRHTDATTAVKLVNGFVKEGWPTDAIKQKDLIDVVKPALSTLWPDAKAFFENTGHGDARAKAFIEEQLRNPRVREIVQQLLEQRAGAKPSANLEVPLELKAKVQESNILVSQNEEAKKRVDAELTKVKDDLSSEYGDPAAKPPKTGTRDAELTRLRANKGTFVSEKTSLTRDIAAKDAKLNQLIAARASGKTTKIDTFDSTGTRTGTRTEHPSTAIQSEIDRLTTELDDPTAGLRAKLRGSEAELTKLEGYERDRVEWTAEKKRLDDEKQALVDQGNLLGANNTLLKGELRDIVNARTNWEKQYVADLKKTMADGLTEHLTEQMEQAEAAQKKVLQDQIANTVDPAEKKLLEGMAGRWDQRKESGVFRKREVTVANKAEVDTDYALLMTPPPKGGPEAVLRKMLTGTQIEDPTLGITRAMTTTEINAKLADKAFVDKMQGDVVTKLLERRLDTAKMPEADLKYIAESPWGEATIQSALQNKEAVNKLQAQMRELGLSAGTMHEMFSKKGVKKGLLLGILLGIITFGVVPGIMVKEMLKGEGS